MPFALPWAEICLIFLNLLLQRLCQTVKLLSFACGAKAMALTTLLSAIFFDYELRFHALGGYLVTFLSMCLYYTPSEVLLSTDAEFFSSVDFGKYFKTNESMVTSTAEKSEKKSS